MTHLGPDAAAPFTDRERARRKNGGAQHDHDDGTCLMPVPDDVAAPSPSLGILKVNGRDADRQFVYRDRDGKMLGLVLRWEARNGRRKDFRPITYWRDADGNSRWKAKKWPSGSAPLYGLDMLAVRPDATVLLVEGEKTADAVEAGPLATSLATELYESGVIGITWPGGGRAMDHADFSPLAGRDVIILPDAHEQGEETADALVDILHKVGVRRLRRWKAPPEVRQIKEGGWDIADEIPPGLTAEALVRSVIEAPEIAAPGIVLTLPEFLDGFEPPVYLIDGLFQRHYFYAITAKTGGGKTAVALLVSVLVADPKGGQKLGPHDVEHGRVVYVTRENPTDVRMRLIGMSAKMGFDPADFERTFLVIESVENLEKDMEGIQREVAAFGDVSLVVLDTSFALFQGDDENDAKQMLDHARTQRKLCDLPGRPCVVALCHPIKNAAGAEQLLPRGGGSYLNELDGNFTLWAHDDRLTDMHWTGKLRGPDFERITFRLPTVITTELMDKKRRVLPTVMAEVVTDADVADAEEKTNFQENRLLAAMLAKPDGSLTEWAKDCGWMIKGKDNQADKPNKSLVQRVLVRLVKDKLVAKEGRKYALTKHGKAAAAAPK